MEWGIDETSCLFLYQTLQSKNWNSVGGSLTDKDPSIQINANTRRSGNLAGTNGFYQRSIGLEHLDAIVGVISHQDVVIRINEEVVGIVKLTSTNMTNKITPGIKDWTRLLLCSPTTTFPFDRRPMPIGEYSWPFPSPRDPNFLRNWPFELKTETRWLEPSTTKWFPWESTTTW